MTQAMKAPVRALRMLGLMAIFFAAANAYPTVEGAQAQDLQTIVAVVNDEVVTSYDLDQRIQILILTSGMANTPENRSRLEQRVLQTLIDERLKMQEARRLGISLTTEEFAEQIVSLERGNNLPEGGLPDFARQNGIAPSALEAQLRAELTWQKLIIQTERDRIQVDAGVIDEALVRIEASEGQTEYRVVEILLLADERAGVTKEDALGIAEGLVEQIRGGADFAAIATQFSDSPTATRAGDLGWMLTSEMPPTMAATVTTQAFGSVSDPIEEERGYRIYGLIDRRLANATVDDDTEIGLRVLLIPVPPNSIEAVIREKVADANAIRGRIGSCSEFNATATAAGYPHSPNITRMRLGDMAPRIRSIISSLAEGQISGPLPNPAGIQLVMVCELDLTSVLPSRAEINEILVIERIATTSQRRLRDLRRSAFIEIRG